jgi:hypothetical protein
MHFHALLSSVVAAPLCCLNSCGNEFSNSHFHIPVLAIIATPDLTAVIPLSPLLCFHSQLLLIILSCPLQPNPLTVTATTLTIISMLFPFPLSLLPIAIAPQLLLLALQH